MAETKKKTTGQRSTSGGSRTKSKTAASKSAAASKTTAKKQPARPVRREVGAGVCFVLGLCTLFALCGQDAPVLKFLWQFGCGLIGWGMWLLPFALLVASAMLLFHRGRPVRLRVTCTLLVAPIAGAIAHLFGDATEYAFGFAMFGELYKSGASGTSGGMISGFFAWLMRSGLGTALSAVILIALLIAAIGVAANRQIQAIIKRAKEHERVEYEEQPERERPVKAKPVEVAHEVVPEEPISELNKTASFDVPSPRDESEPEHHETWKERRERKRLLRERAEGVMAPDELINGVNESSVTEPDLGHLPNEVAGPDDPVPPLDLNSDYVQEGADVVKHIAEEVASNVRAIQAMDELRRSRAAETATEEIAVDPNTGEVIEPVDDTPIKTAVPAEETATREESAPKLRPVASHTENTKIVDTLADKEDKVAADVAAELGRGAAATQQGYVYPSTELLKPAPPVVASDATAEMKMNADRLGETLQSFGIDARIVGVTRGPSVTRYELELDRGVKLAKISGLADDIALSLGASGVRIAPIPEKSLVVGIEVPNKTVATVSLRELIESREFASSKSPVAFALGRDISGRAFVGDIEKMPHMLIAGTTGSGKSVCMNSLIISLLYKSSPDDVRLIMVDPKMVELNVYNGIPHLLIPVVTDPKKAAGALQWAVHEMMQRYAQFRDAGARNIDEYNAVAELHEGMKRLPRLVVLIDELADLMLVAAKEVEESICRVAQMGRASGVHLVIATQRPSSDVITGLMKANIPSRVAFTVRSSLDSRIIMDASGAEKLVGHGDMLYLPVGSREATRVQGCFVSSSEVEKVVDFIKQSGEASYSEEVLSHIDRASQEGGDGISSGSGDGEGDYDEMLPQAVDVLLETGQASVSMLQRRLKLGYSRAGRLMDQLEQRGIVGPFQGAKPRAMLITREQWEEMKLNNPEYQ